MFVVTLNRESFKKLGLGAMCCALVVFSALLGRFISSRTVEAAATVNRIESAQDIQTWFTGYGLEVDGAAITADKVKIPRKWDDSFSAFNSVIQQSGMDLTRYKGKTVEKWQALIPASSNGDASVYGVLLVYKKKAIGAYLLEKPSGVVTGLKDAQAAMAQQELEAEQVSGEDYSGDWGERHDEELTDPAQQASGEDYSGDWGERHDEELTDPAQQTSGEDYSGDWGERHDEELTDPAQQASGEDYSGDWGERHDEELTSPADASALPQGAGSVQTSGEPDQILPQDAQYTDLPLDAEGYPVE